MALFVQQLGVELTGNIISRIIIISKMSPDHKNSLHILNLCL